MCVHKMTVVLNVHSSMCRQIEVAAIQLSLL